MTHDRADLLLDFLAVHDEPCPVCGYCLRNLTAPRCPECGAPLQLRVGSPQLRVGPWVFAVVSFALALGFDGVVSLMLLVALAREPAPVWQPYGIVTLFVALAISMLAGILVLARTRPAWHRRPVRRQWAAATLIFCAVGALHILVGVAFILAVN